LAEWSKALLEPHSCHISCWHCRAQHEHGRCGRCCACSPSWSSLFPLLAFLPRPRNWSCTNLYPTNHKKQTKSPLRLACAA
jgi:hypothetical protein